MTYNLTRQPHRITQWSYYGKPKLKAFAYHCAEFLVVVGIVAMGILIGSL